MKVRRVIKKSFLPLDMCEAPLLEVRASLTAVVPARFDRRNVRSVGVRCVTRL
jgi:hypothetical protein